MTSTRLLSTTSDTLTKVAADKPTFLTTIVYLSLSPTRTLVTLTVLLIVNLTLGFAVTFSLVLLTTVLFSLQLAKAVLVTLPTLVTLTIKVTVKDWLAAILSIVQVALRVITSYASAPPL